MAGQGLVDDMPAVQIPQTQVPDDALLEEEKMAKFSQSDEYKRLAEYMNERIEFYKKYLPDGRPINDVKDVNELSRHWALANVVITEFKNVLNTYELANKEISSKK